MSGNKTNPYQNDNPHRQCQHPATLQSSPHSIHLLFRLAPYTSRRSPRIQIIEPNFALRLRGTSLLVLRLYPIPLVNNHCRPLGVTNPHYPSTRHLYWSPTVVRVFRGINHKWRQHLSKSAFPLELLYLDSPASLPPSPLPVECQYPRHQPEILTHQGTIRFHQLRHQESNCR
jgi:hypothetical protein